MNGVYKNYSKDLEEKGVAKITRFHIDDEEVRMFNVRRLFNGGYRFESLEAGDYVRLAVNGQLMMTDTPMERRTNTDFIQNAHGEVMIAGLGIGMILENLIPLCEAGKVTKVVVYEKYQDVIDLVAHRYLDRLPLEVRCADIMEYKPSKEEKYDTLYFDIWPTICDDNLAEIRILHNRWKTHKKDGAWMGSWMVDFLRRRRARENRESRKFWF